MEQNPFWKRWLKRFKRKWDLIKEDVELGGGTHWKERAIDRMEAWVCNGTILKAL